MVDAGILHWLAKQGIDVDVGVDVDAGITSQVRVLCTSSTICWRSKWFSAAREAAGSSSALFNRSESLSPDSDE